MRKNHSRKYRRAKAYQIDYIILPDHPEINSIIVEPMRTIYRNLAAYESAAYAPIIKDMDDPEIRLLAGKIRKEIYA